MDGQCGCKTRTNTGGCHSDRQTDQLNAKGDLAVRDLPERIHKQRRLCFLLRSHHRQIPHIPERTESATEPQINKSFSTELAQSGRLVDVQHQSLSGGNRTLAASAKVLCQNCKSGHSSRSRPKPPCCAAHQGPLCADSALFKIWPVSRQRTFV